MVRLHECDVEIGPRSYVLISDKLSIDELIRSEELMRSLAAGEILIQVAPLDGAYTPHPGGTWVDSLTDIPTYLEANELAILGAGAVGGGAAPPTEVTLAAPTTADVEILFEDGIATDDDWVQVFPGVSWMAKGFAILHDGDTSEPDLLWVFSTTDPGTGVTTHTGRAVSGEAHTRDNFYFVPQTLWVRSAAASNPPDLDISMTRIQAWRG